jgi:hypothetical protein
MKNFICFLIPVITFAAIINDLGAANSNYTYSAPSSVTIRSDNERAAATYHLKINKQRLHYM